MQEINSMGGGRFFGSGGGGGGGGGDRRLRPHHHQALKCPRCDSLNTKFCYYNNYNLSQPRHFCKNCRRYWTKGGVLRNVPVGGGCRKSKRSNNNNNNKPPKNSSSETETTSVPPDHNSNSHSSSESSSLTATTEAVSAPNNNNNMQEYKLLIPSSNPTLETPAPLEQQQQQGTGDSAIFSEIGSFTSLIASTNDALPFGFGSTTIPDASSFQWQHQKGITMSMTGDDVDLKFAENLTGGASLLDHGTLPVDLSAMQNKTGHGGFGSFDWHGGADQGLFDLSNTVDHPYWTHSHWSDHDNSNLFHLP